MCPECNAVHRQRFFPGFTGSQEEPPESPGYICGRCGHVYKIDESDEYDMEADAAYEDWKARLLSGEMA